MGGCIHMWYSLYYCDNTNLFIIYPCGGGEGGGGGGGTPRCVGLGGQVSVLFLACMDSECIFVACNCILCV